MSRGATKPRRAARPLRAGDFAADVSIRPGEFLAEELEARGMTQRDLARRMERPLQVINAIVRGKKSITAETALGLEKTLGLSALFWLSLETQHQLALARERLRKQATGA